MYESVPGLTRDGCLARQDLLRGRLRALNLDAVMLLDRRHVHYFTGYWCHFAFATALLIEQDGPATLVVPLPCATQPIADDVRVYPSNHLGTLVEDHVEGVMQALEERLARCGRLGSDAPLFSWRMPSEERMDLRPMLHSLRATKHADEIALLKRAIRSAEAAYHYAFNHLKTGVTEVELFAGMQAAAAFDVGEVIGEFGNDFQIGATGSAPRRRPAQAGEMAVFDLSVALRGYRSDMCRSFVVGRQPSDHQRDAHARVLEVLELVERNARPGVTCQSLYQEAFGMLDGFRGWTFPHHLGHGIGLDGHERPRLNPQWDDRLEAGNVIAVEPGLYGPDLRAGLRIEQVYLVTDDGLERLTSFPTDLA